MGAGPSTEAEREPLLTPTRPTTNGQPVNSRVYGRRWLVLCLFSLLGFMQGMVWNFWGPIQNSAVRAFGFSKSDIAVLVLWGPVGFIPWLLFMWLMDKKGEFGWYTVSHVALCCLSRRFHPWSTSKKMFTAMAIVHIAMFNKDNVSNVLTK